jgi:hypothetical protein
MEKIRSKQSNFAAGFDAWLLFDHEDGSSTSSEMSGYMASQPRRQYPVLYNDSK